MSASGEVHTGEQHRAAESLLFNPHTYDPSHFDDVTRRLLRATIDWFEYRGKEKLQPVTLSGRMERSPWR